MIKQQVEGNFIVKVFYDEFSTNPRDIGGMTKMICFHKRYKLGDKHDYKFTDYSGWEEMKEDIIKNENVEVIYPLYLYDHSGITISTSPFSCQWDSGQVGWIYITKDDVKEYGISDPGSMIEGDVEMYDKYLRNEVYYYQVIFVESCNLGHKHEQILETVGGWYDIDECLSEGLNHIKEYETV